MHSIKESFCDLLKNIAIVSHSEEEKKEESDQLMIQDNLRMSSSYTPPRPKG